MGNQTSCPETEAQFLKTIDSKEKLTPTQFVTLAKTFMQKSNDFRDTLIFLKEWLKGYFDSTDEVRQMPYCKISTEGSESNVFYLCSTCKVKHLKGFQACVAKINSEGVTKTIAYIIHSKQYYFIDITSETKNQPIEAKYSELNPCSKPTSGLFDD